MLARAGLTLARFSLAAWVGAASLFVVTGVLEVTSKGTILANSAVRDALVAVRFPAYYVFGFVLVGLAGLGLIAAWRHYGLSRKRYFTCLALVVVSFVLIAVDYLAIYSPLLEMVTPPGNAKPAGFTALHKASMYINSLDVGLLFVAAVLVCWPVSSSAAVGKNEQPPAR